MEKKYELTPEMRAKIEEIKKAHGVRELSRDDLDGVAGGGEPVVNVYGQPMTETEFNDFMLVIADAVGYAAAFEIFIEITGASHYRTKAMGGGTTDQERMALLLQDYWKTVKFGQ